MTVAFNPQFLLDGLSAIEGEEVVLETMDPLKPATLQGQRPAGLPVPPHARPHQLTRRRADPGA